MSVSPKRDVATRGTSVNSVDGTLSGYNSCDSSVVMSDLTPMAGQEELRCVITVIRHGDRSPKQKLKVKVSEPLILKYFHKHSLKGPRKDLKIKDRNPMKEFLAVTKQLISEKEKHLCDDDDDLITRLYHIRDVLERWTIGGLNRKLQLKPQSWTQEIDGDGNTYERCNKLMLILKWGGNLTKLGEKQAISLGQKLRHEMYPDQAGGGILRLHSTFRHDLKIKTSDGGRVMKTAAAFAKGMLELEGDVSIVWIFFQFL